jgi:aryl-alcohol dehydrogenase-like predicted oxidoreductase
MDSLDILVKQGKVLYLGASDMPAWIVSACNEYAKCVFADFTRTRADVARAHNKAQFVVLQTMWNAMEYVNCVSVRERADSQSDDRERSATNGQTLQYGHHTLVSSWIR